MLVIKAPELWYFEFLSSASCKILMCSEPQVQSRCLLTSSSFTLWLTTVSLDVIIISQVWVWYAFYYMSLRQSWGWVLITRISYKCTWDIACLFPKDYANRCFFCEIYKQWFLVVFTYQSFLCTITADCFIILINWSLHGFIKPGMRLPAASACMVSWNCFCLQHVSVCPLGYK